MKLKFLKSEDDQARALVEKFLQNRSEQAFRKLYRLTTPSVYGLALRLAGGVQQIAEEAVQESWVRAVQKLPQFRWQSTFQTWLSGIVIRCCQEIFRANKKNTTNKIDLDVTDKEAQTSDLLQIVDLEAAIASLPDGYRRILVLHDIEGYKHKEIAELIQIDIGTSKSQLSRARNALRKCV